VDKKAEEEKSKENTRDKMKETTKRRQGDARCDINDAAPGLATLTIASRGRKNRKMTNHKAPSLWEPRFTS